MKTLNGAKEIVIPLTACKNHHGCFLLFNELFGDISVNWYKRFVKLVDNETFTNSYPFTFSLISAVPLITLIINASLWTFDENFKGDAITRDNGSKHTADYTVTDAVNIKLLHWTKTERCLDYN
jgi:hypothetical protein